MDPRPPATVIALLAFVAAFLAVFVVLYGVERELLTYGPILVAACIGVAVGLWLAWLFLVVVSAGDVILALRNGPAWSPLLVNATILLLLLAPPTWRHARRGRPRFLARLV